MTDIVNACIIKNNKVLIGKILTGKYKDKWTFPGGKVKFGETDKETLEREVYSEVNVNINVKSLIVENIYEDDSEKLRLKLYYCDYLSGKVKSSDYSVIKWIDKKDLVNYDFTDAYKEIIDNL